MLGTAHLTMFHKHCVGMFKIYFHINFNMPTSSGLLVVGTKLRIEEKFCSTTIILCKK
jgi:hypothetical protein